MACHLITPVLEALGEAGRVSFLPLTAHLQDDVEVEPIKPTLYSLVARCAFTTLVPIEASTALIED